jgi:putative transcriptional regulator
MMSSFGKELIQSAKEARSFARGEADASMYRVHVPQDVDVRALRTRLGMSQSAFAGRFGFNVSAVREWEQKRRRPDRSARVLLTVINHSPDLVDDALKASMSVNSAKNPARARTAKTQRLAARTARRKGTTRKIGA